jgi:SAM-dependent methyltransferase
MSEITILSQIAKIRTFEKGHRATQVLNTGFRFGILNALAESLEGLTVPELSLKLMLYEPFLKIWCQTAYHFEIIDSVEKGRFKLQAFLDEVLGLVFPLSNHPGPVPGLAKKEEDDPLGRFIRTGQTGYTISTPEASFSRSRATRSMSTIFQSMIFPEIKYLEKELDEGCAFLDIGCGTGQLVLDFAQRFKRSTFTGVDPDPYGIEQAEQAISEQELEGRVSVANRGGEEMDLTEQFDFAAMVLTLHEILPEVRLEALRKTFKALKKEGRFMILDYPYPRRLEDFRNPRYEYGIIEQYFEAIGGIIHISEEEQDDLLSRAGFTEIKRIAVGEGGMLDFITAKK